MDQTITKIEYLSEGDRESKMMKITLSNGTVIKAASDGNGSWLQWGGTKEELYITMPLVRKHNSWLNGREVPW